ncbi:MAG TPA: arginase family protein [Rhodoglobus sp.]|nr:arginase family protein [Rhodoglobus sp.]
MVATFVVIPQWQGSGSSRAMRLVDGAEAIRGDLPSSSTRTIEIPLEAGDGQGTAVHRLSSIALVRDRLAADLATIDGPVITIGGDCGVELAAIEHVAGDDVAVIWLDAHPDLNTPESSPSGAFTGMVLRTLLGEGPAQLVPGTPLKPSRVILAGARSFDPGEDEYIAAHRVVTIGADEVSGQSLVDAVVASGAASVYVHIDLDVLDPEDIQGLGYPEPFGVRSADLVNALKALVARFPLAGAGITEFAPASPRDAVEDMPTILRLVGALASAAG